MVALYFKNFKTIDYANNKVVDITERVTVTPNALKNPYAYYPLSIVNGARADTVASTTYKDPYLSWSIYLANDIVDPYYEWYLNDNQFTDFIVGKYGSIANATSKIVYWRNNWANTNSISADTYSGLTVNQKDYWQTTGYDAYGTAISYSRKKDDWKISTNYTVSLTITGASNNTPYTNNEIIKFSAGGTAQAVISNSSVLVVQHTQGSIDAGYVYGLESGSNCSITANSINYLSNNIPTDLISYWSPVSYYDAENEKNEGNKIVNLLKPDFIPDFVKTVKKLLSE